MSITTFKNLYVEELFLDGNPFTVENFKGPDGDVPEIDVTAPVGDAGLRWNPFYDFLFLKSPEEDVQLLYKLINPTIPDTRHPIDVTTTPIEYHKYNKTMMFIMPDSTWNTKATVTITDHLGNPLGVFRSESQVMKFVNKNGTWKIC